MDSPTAACPPRETIERLVSGGASESADPSITRHVETCPACAELAEQIRNDNDLLAEVVQANMDPGVAPPAEHALPDIEGYDVHGEIHRGAQGVVYRATQLATKRTVAVKTLVQGAFATERQRYRFEREVELVAALRHPSVVTIYDSGRTADGGYFLAMEHVDGVTLDAFLRSETGRVRRLELFAGICDAVQAAHRRGIIHRDLKPANILVDAEGQPHVLDFGLARREHGPSDGGESSQALVAPSATVPGEFLGTLAYAAPEQVAGRPDDVDVRCDVYALGVILYEMLAGERPYRLQGSMAEIVETVTRAAMAAPSALDPALDEDLDTIALRALAREPDRRYESAGALRDDVRHYLAGEPIEARRDSQLYVLRKTAARHRVALAVAGVFVVVVVAFGINMTVLYRQASDARDVAATESVRAKETLASFLELLATEKLKRRTAEDTLPVLFAEADRIVGVHLTDQPETAAAVRRQLGLAQLERGDWKFAQRQFDQVLALMRVLEAPLSEVAEAHHNCGRALWHLGRFDDAAAHYSTALAMRQELYGDLHEDVAESHQHLAATERQRGHDEEALSHYREALSIRRSLHHGDHDEVAMSLNSLGVMLRDLRRFEAALESFREAVDMVSRIAGEDDPAPAAAILHNVAMCLVSLDRIDEAEVEVSRALAIKRRLYDDTHESLARTNVVRAEILLRQDKADEARALLTAAMDVQEAALDDGHPALADSLVLLGRILLRLDMPAEARAPLRRAFQIRRDLLPAEHWKVTQVRELLAMVERQARPVATSG